MLVFIFIFPTTQQALWRRNNQRKRETDSKTEGGCPHRSISVAVYSAAYIEYMYIVRVCVFVWKQSPNCVERTQLTDKQSVTTYRLKEHNNTRLV